MVERVGRFDVRKLQPVSWSGSDLKVSALLTAENRAMVAGLMTTHRPGDILPVQSTCRPDLDGLYSLRAVQADDQGAGSGAKSGSPVLVSWDLTRLRSSVFRTQASVAQRPSAIPWSPTGHYATIGTPGTLVRYDTGMSGVPPGSISSSTGLVTTVLALQGGAIEWVVDPHRYYEGAASIWSMPNIPFVFGDEPERTAVPGTYAPMDRPLILSNGVMEIRMSVLVAGSFAVRRWLGGGTWSTFENIRFAGSTGQVRWWTISANTPDRVAVTAEYVSGLAEGVRMTAALHRGSRHVEVTVQGTNFAPYTNGDEVGGASRSNGGITWARGDDLDTRIMTDADAGLILDDSSPFKVHGPMTGGTVRYGITVDPPGSGDGAEGVDEWPYFATSISKPLWGTER